MLLPNPKPALLSRFMHAVVWRHTASLEAQGIRHWLGPYHQRMQLALFNGGPPLDGYIIDPRYHSDGAPTQIGLNPCPAYMDNLRLVRFDIGGLAFHLKTDNRPFPKEINLASLQLNPLMVITMDPLEITHDPFLRGIAAAAAQAGKLGPRW